MTEKKHFLIGHKHDNLGNQTFEVLREELEEEVFGEMASWPAVATV